MNWGRSAAALSAAMILGALLHPAAAAAPSGTVLLSLAQRPGSADALHRLARTPPAAGPLAARRAAVSTLAPDAQHRNAVLDFAQRHDLTVLRADAWTVTLSGPANELATLFGTRLSGGHATTPLRSPTALVGHVGAVSGLDDRPLLRPHAIPYGLTSASMHLQYGVPLAGWTGAGVTVGTLNLTGWDPTDLTAYAAAAGLTVAPGQITTVAVDNPANPLVPDGSGDDLEVAMDAQAILATAPDAKQRQYFAPNNGVGTIDVFNQMATDGAAGLLQVASTSWGLCEPKLAAYPWYLEQIGQAVDRMLAAGVTLFAAAGDAGKYDCSRPEDVDNTLAVDFPASYPGVVAVGGTRVGLTETAWGNVLDNPGTAYAGSGGGGGRSAVFGRPAYQPAGESQRLVPDVASVGDPSTGMGIYNRGQWYLGGGTSLGAPTWAGFTAAALSGAGRTTGLGDIHSALYAHPEAFRDVVAGSNGYAASPGFDLATGLGAPDWTTLGPLLTGAPPLPPPPDTYAPTTTVSATLTPGTDTRVRFTWAGSDPAPSAGLSTYDVQVTQVGGSTVWSATTATTSKTLTLVQGRSYTLSARSRDLAGHVGAWATATRAVPKDDRAFTRTGTWGRGPMSGDFLGSHVVSRFRGATASMTFTGRGLTLGVVKARSGGYADIYLDGRRVKRVDLYATRTLRRQPISVLSSTRSARHTVKIVVVGAHRAGATNSYVFLDSATIKP